MSEDALNAISNHFGPALVWVGRYRRISFVDAWKSEHARLRQHAILAAFHALHHDPCAAKSVAIEQRLIIAGLLREVLLQESGQD